MNETRDRIAVFLPSLRGGGAERVTLNLIEGFLREGIRVDLLLAQKEGAYLEKVPLGLTLIDLHAPRVRYAVRGLKAYLQAKRPVGLLSAMGHANVVALLARRLAGVPTRVVATLHNNMSVQIKDQPGWRRMLSMYISKRAYLRADAVVAVSQGVADDTARLTRFPRERIEVIYNPVVTDELYANASEPLEHPWFKSGEPAVLLSVGRLTRQKNYGLLIRAMERVRESQPARLIILGEGEERPSLEKLIASLGLQDSVALPGFVTNPYAYMRNAALFVLSSHWEGLPTVLIEAMAVGVPVVSTDCPSGPFEILKGGKLGPLVPVGDLSALATAILQVLERKVHYPRDLDLGRFEKEQAVQSYLKLLRGA
jgi:glycosyltransferase involved in cell wall biosynthesis